MSEMVPYVIVFDFLCVFFCFFCFCLFLLLLLLLLYGGGGGERGYSTHFEPSQSLGGAKT